MHLLNIKNIYVLKLHESRGLFEDYNFNLIDR